MFRLSKPRGRFLAPAAVAAVTAALAIGPGIAAAGTGATTRGVPVANTGTSEALLRTGSVDLRTLPRQVKHSAITIGRSIELDQRNGPAASASALPPPRPASSRLVVNQARRGFEGINEADNSGANGFALEPPDQGLCVGKVGSTTVLAEEVNARYVFTPTSK